MHPCQRGGPGRSPAWASAGPSRDPCRGQAGCGQAAGSKGPPRLGAGQGAHLRFLPAVPARDTSSLSPDTGDGWGEGRHADGVAWGQEQFLVLMSLSSWELGWACGAGKAGYNGEEGD